MRNVVLAAFLCCRLAWGPRDLWCTSLVLRVRLGLSPRRVTVDVLALQILVLSGFSSGPLAINVRILTAPATLAVNAVEFFSLFLRSYSICTGFA